MSPADNTSELKQLDVHDVYTRQRIATVPLADERAIDDAISRAHEAFATTRTLAAYERADVLRAAAAGIERRARQLADTIVAEAGKPVTLAEAEVSRAVATFTAAAEEARHAMGELVDADAFAPGKNHFGLMRRFPIGVIYGMTPFNFPLNLVAHKVAPAIATGNTIVVKPSPRTPLSALALREILSESGVIPGQVEVIVTPNELALRPLDDPRVRHVSFTGSVPVGWSIKSKAGMKRVTLELGGNAGLIVHEDAELEQAVPAAASGGFGYAGQSCISVQRIVIHRPIYQRFRDALVAHVREHVKAGDPRRRDVILGPLIDDAAAARTKKLIDDAVRAGARLLCGGKFIERNVLEAAVLENVDTKLDIGATEAFAPIVTLHPYDAFDDAIRFVNDSPYGLQAGVFTRDIGRIMRAFEQLEVGGVMVNQVPTFRVETMPYGGVKQSGFGREGVRFAMEEMTEPRVMLVRLE
jgi:glyceraldehyde-3-phosphate dehydrogenase (NADP+)